jgi:DNA repair exonuclease SbcCD nuclease subunit
MKIAITADLHLKNRKDHPERYHALENILNQMIQDNINTLIIAGDLFDITNQYYIEFEEIFMQAKYKNIHCYIIPGNHDFNISKSHFTHDNIMVITEPEIINFDSQGHEFMFLPYKKNKTMGEYIGDLVSQLAPNQWVLIGHGDWYEGLREPNPTEQGVYMPLTRPDIEKFQPMQVILGHIHKPTTIESKIVQYVGSPCGLDVTETGHRRFIVMDTINGNIEAKKVNTDYIYFDESLIVYPHPDETAYLQKQIDSMIEKWEVTASEKIKVRVHIAISGYTSDRAKIKEITASKLKDYMFYKNGEPDYLQLYISDDKDKEGIGRNVVKYFNGLGWPEDSKEPDRNKIILEALKTIYGDK